MSKALEQFLLKCELARTILMKLWVKCLITDEEKENAYKRHSGRIQKGIRFKSGGKLVFESPWVPSIT